MNWDQMQTGTKIEALTGLLKGHAGLLDLLSYAELENPSALDTTLVEDMRAFLAESGVYMTKKLQALFETYRSEQKD